MIIYADLIFFLNLIFNYMALLILGKSMKLYAKPLRLILASAIGATGAIILFCIDFNLAALKLIPAFFMILCAYGWNGKKIIYRFGVFLVILAAISGIVLFMISVFPNGANSIIKNGIIYFDLPGKLFFTVFIAAYPIMCILSKGLKSWRNRKIYITTIQRGLKSVVIKALFDSGNTLKEPITGKPVVIAEWDNVKSLFENPVAFEFLIEKADEYKLWIIPYRALGNRNGRIFAFLADRILIDGKPSERVFIGITEQRLSEEYHALLNAELL